MEKRQPTHSQPRCMPNRILTAIIIQRWLRMVQAISSTLVGRLGMINKGVASLREEMSIIMGTTRLPLRRDTSRNHIYGTDTQLRPNQYAHAQLTPATSLPSSGRRFSTRKAGRGHVDVRLELIPTGGTSSPPSAPSARLDDSTTRLRNEMETIRQQMSTLLQEREYDLPPPEYVPR